MRKIMDNENVVKKSFDRIIQFDYIVKKYRRKTVNDLVTLAEALEEFLDQNAPVSYSLGIREILFDNVDYGSTDEDFKISLLCRVVETMINFGDATSVLYSRLERVRRRVKDFPGNLKKLRNDLREENLELERKLDEKYRRLERQTDRQTDSMFYLFEVVNEIATNAKFEKRGEAINRRSVRIFKGTCTDLYLRWMDKTSKAKFSLISLKNTISDLSGGEKLKALKENFNSHKRMIGSLDGKISRISKFVEKNRDFISDLDDYYINDLERFRNDLENQLKDIKEEIKNLEGNF